MSFDKYLNKARKLANDPKVREKLNSEKAEKFSDSILDKAASAADSLTKGKHTDRIAKARDAADRAVGTDGPGARGTDPRSSGDRLGDVDRDRRGDPDEPRSR
ncbi:antitoxin protein of toxin-antitoxin system [Brevibacterium sanguinis]|uniref:Antitoxin protein of toxin-antitoxin system n=2 Tax=Brevibacterium TaxID=1696 RepID=A0A366INA3_9MICO|nr:MULTISPECIES: Rv0909 family putative TA system antitoxin [Brevibacterium]RBP68020.1 antitoxin protein of toxin-antitoxin system [Brevibacterium sanguinis]RBP74563.1 antitoxin protein of toxin-antitoxin system [Brevibacterium celere]